MAKQSAIDRTIIAVSIYISAIVLLAILISLARWGIDLKSVFFGTPWNSHLEQTRGIEAVEGAVVFVTLIFGSLLVFGIMALIKDKMNHKTPSPTTEAETKPEAKTE